MQFSNTKRKKELKLETFQHDNRHKRTLSFFVAVFSVTDWLVFFQSLLRDGHLWPNARFNYLNFFFLQTCKFFVQYVLFLSQLNIIKIIITNYSKFFLTGRIPSKYTISIKNGWHEFNLETSLKRCFLWINKLE